MAIACKGRLHVPPLLGSARLRIRAGGCVCGRHPLFFRQVDKPAVRRVLPGGLHLTERLRIDCAWQKVTAGQICREAWQFRQIIVQPDRTDAAAAHREVATAQRCGRQGQGLAGDAADLEPR